MTPSPPPITRPTAVIFDLGGVLIDWDPRHLYRSLIADEAEMEAFLAEVVSPAWNLEQDRGRPFVEAVDLLVHEHPDRAELIRTYWNRWPDMLGEAHHDTVAILGDLRSTGVRLLALTNWSAETYRFAPDRYPFLAWFEAVVVSGAEGLIKPDPILFRLVARRHGIVPAETVFIDDSAVNVEAAADLGFRALRFRGAEALRADLVELGLLPAAVAADAPDGVH